jgi:RNA recognition motif-containing protein
MPGTEHTFRLNWASFSSGERRPDAGPDHSIFVGDLAPDVTDYLLQETFRVNYPSVRGAKVVTDPNTGRPKGYGFVKFADENEKNRAMTEMNGQYCSTRPMRISAAIPKKSAGSTLQYSAAKGNVCLQFISLWTPSLGFVINCLLMLNVQQYIQQLLMQFLSSRLFSLTVTLRTPL